jgi:hypothetical protein
LGSRGRIACEVDLGSGERRMSESHRPISSFPTCSSTCHRIRSLEFISRRHSGRLRGWRSHRFLVLLTPPHRFVDLRGWLLQRGTIKLGVTHHRADRLTSHEFIKRWVGDDDAISLVIWHNFYQFSPLHCSPLLITLTTHIELLPSLHPFDVFLHFC